MMHPKTFFVRLRQPLGVLTQEAYLFYLHVDSAEDAFAWVTRICEGIDIRQRPANPHRIGNSNPVSVTDCDCYQRRARVDGHFKVVPTEPGHFRRSEQDVLKDLHKVFKNLKGERIRLGRSFASLKQTYERDGVPWVFDRLVEIKQAHDKAKGWEERLQKELPDLFAPEELELPEQRAQAA